MTKERYQNPVIGDDVILRLFTYNGNAPSDFNAIQSVEIFFLDPQSITASNPDGRTLVTTVPGASVVHDDTGQYHIQTTLQELNYSLGNYLDVWTVVARIDDPVETITNTFSIYPDLWFTNTAPVVYDFDFVFRPNKIRKGSKKYLIIEVTPNVPKASDLARYYENLATVSPLMISIEQECGNCLPAEADLRLVVDAAPVELREKTNGYYLLDTTNMDEGIYNIWFTMAFGETNHISEKIQLQVF